MAELRDLFAHAIDGFSSRVSAVREDQWRQPTPCTDWDVRALVNHLVYEARWAPPLLEGRTIAAVGDRFDGDLLGEDPKAAYDDAVASALAAVDPPGALERTVHLSYGDTPASGYLMQLTGDFVVHAWDLARGIGADERLDPDMVRFVYDAAEPMAEMLAASGMFGERVPVPDSSDPQTKLLALFGRRA